MTYEQIKFAIKIIRKFENQRKAPCYEAMDSLLDRTRFYFTEIDFQNMYLYTYRISSSLLTNENMISDCNVIIASLEGMLAKDKNYPIVRDIIMDFIHQNIKFCKNKDFVDRNQFSRTAQEIFESKLVTGCTDYAYVFACLARQLEISTTSLGLFEFKELEDNLTFDKLQKIADEKENLYNNITDEKKNEQRMLY